MFNWLFGEREYVNIMHGSAHVMRRVYWDGDNRPYVVLDGVHVDLRKTTREWYPLNKPRQRYIE